MVLETKAYVTLLILFRYPQKSSAPLLGSLSCSITYSDYPRWAVAEINAVLQEGLYDHPSRGDGGQCRLSVSYIIGDFTATNIDRGLQY